MTNSISTNRMQIHTLNFKSAFYLVSESLRFLISMALVLLIFPVLLINFAFVSSNGFPTVFGKGYYLISGKSLDYSECKLMTVYIDGDCNVGDSVVYACRNGYATGTVSVLTKRGEDRFVAVSPLGGEDSVVVLPNKMIVGVAKEDVPYVGAVIAFFAKYRFAVEVICALIAASAFAECFFDANQQKYVFLK